MGEAAVFNFNSPRWLSSHFQRTKKKKKRVWTVMTTSWCFGIILSTMGNDPYGSFTQKMDTPSFHTKLLILARSSLPSPVAKPDPKCHAFPSQPLPICPRAELPWEQPPFSPSPAQVNWVTRSGQARGGWAKNGGKNPNNPKPTAARNIYVFVYNEVTGLQCTLKTTTKKGFDRDKTIVYWFSMKTGKKKHLLRSC